MPFKIFNCVVLEQWNNVLVQEMFNEANSKAVAHKRLNLLRFPEGLL